MIGQPLDRLSAGGEDFSSVEISIRKCVLYVQCNEGSVFQNHHKGNRICSHGYLPIKEWFYAVLSDSSGFVPFRTKT